MKQRIGSKLEEREGRGTIELREGVLVDYHEVIGGPITSRGHWVRFVGKIGERKVAWITGKAGAVDIAALSVAKEEVYFDLALERVLEAIGEEYRGVVTHITYLLAEAAAKAEEDNYGWKADKTLWGVSQILEAWDRVFKIGEGIRKGNSKCG